MIKTKLPITNDYIWKKIFAKKGNESILKDFLIAILEIPIEKVEVQAEVSLEKQLEENKLGRLDILAILNNDTIVNIEVQVINPYDFIDRTLYYWSGNYYNALTAGENYNRTKKTIAINILNYEQFENGPYHEIARLKRDYKNYILTDKMEIHFIQIPKFVKEKRGIQTKMEQWLQFISQSNPKGVELAMKKNKEIKKANDEYEYLTGNEAERRLAFLREKAIRDEKSMVQGAREEGERIGEIRGKKLGEKMGKSIGEKTKQLEIAKKMLDTDMPIKQISELTGLSANEIKKLS